MCGIAGLLDLSRQSTKTGLQDAVTAMACTLKHRGPDDEGIWVQEQTGIALGFRRLSILDLTPTGHQPMHSACGRYVIVFNGEIYNFQALRRELETLGQRFRGRSDTEVLIEGVSRWGLQTTLTRANGMFAFALWDKRTRELHLVRDRLGEKPLYYAQIGSAFIFGSELKALNAHPAFAASINRDALQLYFRYNCIPAPFTIYQEVSKLPPAAMLTVSVSAEGSTEKTLSSYWSAEAAALRGIQEEFEVSEGELIAGLDKLLRESVALRMEADVPLGAFLSGGIDSSTVVALMQAQSNRPVRTFSIGFQTEAYDESKYAAAVAHHLGTEHTGVIVTSTEAMDVIPRLAAIYDEPFSDSSQIPTYLVSRLARQQVTVSLSGDGGDELFAGYNRYVWVPELWDRIKSIPESVRSAAARALNGISPQHWDALFSWIQPLLPERFRQQHPADKMQKIIGLLGTRSPDEMYLTLASHWKNPESFVFGAHELPTRMTDARALGQLTDPVHRMMALDTVTYLPDDILVKLDRASMAVSLEARVPLLDHRLLEFAWRIPLELKIRNGQGKWALRQVLKRYVPEDLMSRPKSGFAVPLDQWLRETLREWAEALLEEGRLRDEGYLNPGPIREKWSEHLSGKRNWQYELWDVLMFQAWLENRRASRF